jgi:hypothetical protein
MIHWKMTRIRFRQADLEKLDSVKNLLQKTKKTKVYRASLIRRYVREGVDRDLAAASMKHTPDSVTIPLS